MRAATARTARGARRGQSATTAKKAVLVKKALLVKRTVFAKKAVLVGPCPVSKSELMKMKAALKGAVLIAVDGGLVTCRKVGLKPDLAVGDWDSLRSRSPLDGVPHITLARDKDQSDTYYALLGAITAGAREVEGYGLTGGRPDHHFAVLADSVQAVSSGHLECVHLVGADAEYRIFSGELSLKLKLGSLVSVFAMGGNVTGVTLQGLRFPLKGETLLPSSRGLSNVVERSSVRVSCDQGVLMVVVPAV